jgi:GNAT superfamily N-acetyltransferase
MRQEQFDDSALKQQSSDDTDICGHFWHGMFSPRGVRAVCRAARSRTWLSPATETEVRPFFDMAKSRLALADDLAIRRMHAKNPDIIQTLRRDPGGPACGLFAYLPLNEFGAAAIAYGAFDGAHPDPAWIVASGETPVAMYEWLYVGPGLYMQTLPAIGEIYAAQAPGGCPVFSKGSAPESAAILTKLGFMAANTVYPRASDMIVVLLPTQNTQDAATATARLWDIRQVRDMAGLTHVIAIRAATYIAEQFPLHAEEFDGNDFCATHFVGYINGDPAAAIRLRWFADFVKIERLAVKVEYRKSRLAFALVRAAGNHARAKGFSRLYGHASDEIAPFWRLLGGSEMVGRAPFRFANIEYREMSIDLNPDPLAIRFGVPPMVTIRPEGLWDEPSALDWSNIGGDPTRETLLKAHARVPKRAAPG